MILSSLNRAAATATLGATLVAIASSYCAPQAAPRQALSTDRTASTRDQAPSEPDASMVDIRSRDAALEASPGIPVEASPPHADAATTDAAGAHAPGDAAICSAPKKVRWLPAAPDAWTQCGRDSHCVLTPAMCCSCGMLPASLARAVNRPSVARGNPFCAPQSSCPACAGSPNPDVEAVCINGRCRAKETLDPCAVHQSEDWLGPLG